MNMQKKRKREGYESVNESQREEMWNLFANHFLMQPCVSAISKKILGNGIKVERKGAVADLHPLIDAVVREKYHAFVRDAIEHIAVQGFFAYTLVPSDARSGRLSYPVVVPWHAYEARHGLTTHCEAEVKCTAKGEDKKIFETVTIFPVSRDGTLSSPVAAASRYCFMLQDAENCDALAYSILSDPPVLTRHKTDHAFDTRDLAGGTVPGLAAQMESDNMAVRNRININVYKQQQRLIAALNDHSIDTATAFWQTRINPATGREDDTNTSHSYAPKFVPLPSDAEVAQLQLPHPRADMVNYRRQCFEIIATALGVPLGVVSSMTSGASVKQQHNQAHEMFLMTCDSYANAVGAAVGKIFAQSFTTLKSYEVKVEFPGLEKEWIPIDKEASRKTLEAPPGVAPIPRRPLDRETRI